MLVRIGVDELILFRHDAHLILSLLNLRNLLIFCLLDAQTLLSILALSELIAINLY